MTRVLEFIPFSLFYQFHLLIIVFLLFICFKMSQKVGWFASLAWLYFSLNASILAFWPNFEPILPGLKHQLSTMGAQNLILLLVIPLLVFINSFNFLSYSIVFLYYLFFIDAICIIFGFRGLMTGNTLDTSLIAALIPITSNGAIYLNNKEYLKINRYLYLVVSLLAIFMAGGATSYLCLMAMGFVYCLKVKRYKELSVAVLALGLLIYLFGSEAFKPGDRPMLWAQHMDFWLQLPTSYHWFGTGFGSYQWIGPFLNSKFAGKGFIWMHNDYLQLLFETGYIGLLTLIGLITMWFKKEWNRSEYASNKLIMMTGFITTMLTYSPLHSPLGILLALIILYEPERVSVSQYDPFISYS